MVVLPFANIGGDPEQDYFADGVTESLTTDLSRISGSFVIGRNTAFTFKGKHVDLKQVGRDLNVRYVLEGSVQRAGNRMRGKAQERLCRRYRKLAHAGKLKTVITAAIARELSGFVWAIAKQMRPRNYPGASKLKSRDCEEEAIDHNSSKVRQGWRHGHGQENPRFH